MLLHLFKSFSIDQLCFRLEVLQVGWIGKDGILGHIEFFKESISLLCDFCLSLQNPFLVKRGAILIKEVILFSLGQSSIYIDKLL